MASMPKPPAGLADRIKADIPDLLGTARERERLSSSIAFNLRVAASIILLISSAYLCVQLLSRAGRNEARPEAVALMKTARPAMRAPLPASSSAPAVVPPVAVPQQARAGVSIADEAQASAAPARRRVTRAANGAERDERAA